MNWKVKSIDIRFREGNEILKRPDRYEGSIEFLNGTPIGDKKIALPLSNEDCEQLIQLFADTLIRSMQEATESIKQKLSING